MAARSAVLLLLAAGPAFAQPVPLGESSKPGECSRYTIDLTLAGNLIVTQDGGRQPIKLEARARHVFAERTLTIDAGLPHRSARFYEVAGATAIVGGERVDHNLANDRRLVVAHRSVGGLFCYSPAGPVTRDELDLVTEHFNPQCLPGLLSGRDTNPNDTWPLDNPTAQAACQFDGLIKNGLTGKLTGVANGIATFTIEGTAEGIESGGKVAITVTATGTFDVAARQVTNLTWKQKDNREPSPVGPASQVEATITVKREALPAEPKELTDAALAVVPKGEVPAALTHLRHADPKARYTVVYPRDWHVTGQTDSHLILRLLDRGEFVAQATVTAWKDLPPGRRVGADEFKKAVVQAPGWVAGKVLEEGEVPAGPNRWLYRVAAEGKIDDLPVVQHFYVLAGAQGEHVVVTCVMKPDKVRAVAGRDAALTTAIEFGKR